MRHITEEDLKQLSLAYGLAAKGVSCHRFNDGGKLARSLAVCQEPVVFLGPRYWALPEKMSALALPEEGGLLVFLPTVFQHVYWPSAIQRNSSSLRTFVASSSIESCFVKCDCADGFVHVSTSHHCTRCDGQGRLHRSGGAFALYRHRGLSGLEQLAQLTTRARP